MLLILTLRSSALRTTISASASTPFSRLPPLGRGSSSLLVLRLMLKVSARCASRTRPASGNSLRRESTTMSYSPLLISYVKIPTISCLRRRLLIAKAVVFCSRRSRSGTFFVDAKFSPEILKPLPDRKNNILGEYVLCLASRVLLSPSPLVIVVVPC